jgi:hypothetical protein
MRKILKLLGAGALFAALSMVPASAQPTQATPSAQTPEAQVRSYLGAAAPVHQTRGYRPAAGVSDLIVPLRLEGAYLWPVTLRAGVNYRVFGVCDDDCTDVDMEIYGADGNLADRDIALNDTPFVQVTPRQSGRYYVRVWLANCTTEPCTVGARLVQGGQPEERQASEPTESNGGGYEQVVASELDDSGAPHIAAGYAVTGPDVVVPVRVQGEGHRETVRLQAGRPYIFQGACDQDCTDVDMELLDARGTSLVSDVATDDRPVLRYTPQRAGDYTVRLWVAQCSVEPCYVGLRSYARNR